jgi:hypothetical protein
MTNSPHLPPHPFRALLVASRPLLHIYFREIRRIKHWLPVPNEYTPNIALVKDMPTGGATASSSDVKVKLSAPPTSMLCFGCFANNLYTPLQASAHSLML